MSNFSEDCDCAFKPDYVSSVSPLSHALYKSRTVLNPEKLLDYTHRLGSDAVVRRIGLLLEKQNNSKIMESISHTSNS